jgi:hypothetical protein
VTGDEIDPRVTAILDRLHRKVRRATREAIDAFHDLAKIDPTLRLPPQQRRRRMPQLTARQ